MKIIVRRDDGTEADVTEAVGITYDCLRSSLDWGSGFLDAEEVNAVVRLAEAAGFPDFEDLVAEVWESRNPSIARNLCALEAERRGVGKYWLVPVQDVIPDVARAAFLNEVHGGDTK